MNKRRYGARAAEWAARTEPGAQKMKTLAKGLENSDKGATMDTKIRSPISHRNNAKGNPNAILQFDIELNNRQQKLLDELPEYDSTIIKVKSEVGMTDLAALTAKTGDEFAMFTKGKKRLIIRGNSRSVNFRIEDAKQLAKQGYKFSGDTHPGVDVNGLMASDDDYKILKAFGQKQSVTYNAKGEFMTYRLDD